MYGARPRGSIHAGISTTILEFNGDGTFTKWDLMKYSGTTVGTAGGVVVGTAADAVLNGVALESGTSSSTGVQVDVTPGLIVTMDNDNDTNTFDANYVGQMADMTGTTGAHLVDTSSHTTASSAQLLCVAYNPQGFGVNTDTSIGNYVVKEVVP